MKPKQIHFKFGRALQETAIPVFYLRPTHKDYVQAHDRFAKTAVTKTLIKLGIRYGRAEILASTHAGNARERFSAIHREGWLVTKISEGSV